MNGRRFDPDAARRAQTEAATLIREAQAWEAGRDERTAEDEARRAEERRADREAGRRKTAAARASRGQAAESKRGAVRSLIAAGKLSERQIAAKLGIARSTVARVRREVLGEAVRIAAKVPPRKP